MKAMNAAYGTSRALDLPYRERGTRCWKTPSSPAPRPRHRESGHASGPHRVPEDGDEVTADQGLPGSAQRLRLRRARRRGANFPARHEHDDTIFDADNLAARLEQACSGRRHALFSYEPLTGLEYRSAFVNRTLIATRLRRLGFERVIITIRNQFDVLESAYKQYVRRRRRIAAAAVLELRRHRRSGIRL